MSGSRYKNLLRELDLIQANEDLHLRDNLQQMAGDIRRLVTKLNATPPPSAEEKSDINRSIHNLCYDSNKFLSMNVNNIDAACYYGFPRVAEFLLSTQAKYTPQSNRLGPLALATKRPPQHAKALENEKFEVTQILLEKGVDINTQDSSHGGTALESAIRSGYSSIATILLSQNADPSITNHNDENVCHILADDTNERNLALLKNILAGQDYKHPLDEFNKNHQTPLQIAGEHGNFERVRIMLENGFDPSKKSGIFAGNFLDLALAKHNADNMIFVKTPQQNLEAAIDMFKDMFKSNPANAAIQFNKTLASSNSNTRGQIFSHLITRFAQQTKNLNDALVRKTDTNSIVMDLHSLDKLIAAIKPEKNNNYNHEFYDIYFKTLADKKIPINQREILIDIAMDPDSLNIPIPTPSLKTQIDLNAKGAKNATADAFSKLEAEKSNTHPFHKAIEAGKSVDDIENLIENIDESTNEIRGRLSAKRESDGETPMSLAVSKKQWDTVSFLLNKSIPATLPKTLYDNETRNFLSVVMETCNDKEIMHDILKDSNDLMNRDQASSINGQLPIHVAVEKGDLVAAKLVHPTASHIDDKAKNGQTALHAAVIKEQPEMIVFLLSKGADPSIKFGNKSAYDLGIESGNMSVIHELLDHAFENDHSFDAKALMILAAEKNEPDIIQRLITNKLITPYQAATELFNHANVDEKIIRDIVADNSIEFCAELKTSRNNLFLQKSDERFPLLEQQKELCEFLTKPVQADNRAKSQMKDSYLSKPAKAKSDGFTMFGYKRTPENVSVKLAHAIKDIDAHFSKYDHEVKHAARIKQ